MTADPIAFLDSGIGGLPYLARVRESLPRERFVYVVDRENFPYGEKTTSQVVAAITSVAERLIAREHPRLVVVACNTASVVALEALRSRFSVPFVGVVPAVKPAAVLSRRRRVGVLATRRTVEGEYLRSLIREHASGCEVVSLPAAGLVEFVEQDLHCSSPAEKAARVAVEVVRFRGKKIDTLVLGCTHFLHLEPEFRAKLAQEGIALVDSRDGVARQVVRLLGPAVSTSEERPPDSFYVTGSAPVEERYAYFAARFGLLPAGTL